MHPQPSRLDRGRLVADEAKKMVYVFRAIPTSNLISSLVDTNYFVRVSWRSLITESHTWNHTAMMKPRTAVSLFCCITMILVGYYMIGDFELVRYVVPPPSSPLTIITRTRARPLNKLEPHGGHY